MKCLTWTRRLAPVLGAITAAAGLLSSPLPAAAQTVKPIPVNIGLPLTNYWPAYLARDLKLFEAVGLEPKF